VRIKLQLINIIIKLQYAFVSTRLNGKDLTCFTICIFICVNHGKLSLL